MTVYGMNAFNPVTRLVLILLLSGAVLTQTPGNAFTQMILNLHSIHRLLTATLWILPRGSI
jgi:hypothetical protein